MRELVTISLNGRDYEVPPGTSVAAAMLMAGLPTRHSESGQPRAPLCGMGICFECRVTINGEPHIRACMTTCVEGMKVVTDA